MIYIISILSDYKYWEKYKMAVVGEYGIVLDRETVAPQWTGIWVEQDLQWGA